MVALATVGMLMLIAACKPGTPSQYIQPDDMEDILVDYFTAKAMAQQGRHSEYDNALYEEAVLKKYGVSKAQFDSSLVYYYTRADRFDPIMQRVVSRLEDKALELGASEGEIGKYSHYNATGDTANVWSDRTTALLLPMAPYNRWEFTIDADTTYRRGDELLLMFMSDYMYQTGEKRGVAYMAVQYADTIISRNLQFSISGLSQLRIPADTTRVMKHIKGYFYLDGGSEFSTSARMLFLNSVQLIRFHTKKKDENEYPSDSLPRDSIGGRSDSLAVSRGDSAGGARQVLSPDSGTTLHRMVVRSDSVKTR